MSFSCTSQFRLSISPRKTRFSPAMIKKQCAIRPGSNSAQIHSSIRNIDTQTRDLQWDTTWPEKTEFGCRPGPTRVAVWVLVRTDWTSKIRLRLQYLNWIELKYIATLLSAIEVSIWPSWPTFVETGAFSDSTNHEACLIDQYFASLLFSRYVKWQEAHWKHVTTQGCMYSHIHTGTDKTIPFPSHT